VKIGIIGGLGAESTSKLYLSIIKKSINRWPEMPYPEIIIYSVPQDPNIENKIINGDGGIIEFKKIIQNAINEIEKLSDRSEYDIEKLRKILLLEEL